jgi:hypothetical protein
MNGYINSKACAGPPSIDQQINGAFIVVGGWAFEPVISDASRVQWFCVRAELRRSGTERRLETALLTPADRDG